MSCICCKSSQEEDPNCQSNAEINAWLAKEREKRRKMFNILLLGAGESGKSTFLKQMKIINSNHYDNEQERLEELTNIYETILLGVQTLIFARHEMEIAWDDESNEQKARAFVHYVNLRYWPDTPVERNGSVSSPSAATPTDRSDRFSRRKFEALSSTMHTLWTYDSALKAVWARRNEIQIADAVEYFLNNVQRIGASGYVPTVQDCLYARRPTRAITTYDVPYDGRTIRFHDVGGQLSERRKWMQCFSNMNAIAFLVAVNEYDMALHEDRSVNRLQGALDAFAAVVNELSLANVQIMLFLNKTDLLQGKIHRGDFGHFFTTFTGDPHNMQHVLGFIENMFVGVQQNNKRQIYVKPSTAIQTENIRCIWTWLKEDIIRQNLDLVMIS